MNYVKNRAAQPPALVIATLSDFHGQLEPAYIWSKNGTLQEKGGIARLKTVIDDLRQKYPNKLLLFGSGDYFTEDFRVGKYFAAFQEQAVADFLNKLSLDTSTIGNHEFDFGIESADKALKACRFPFVATNLKQSSLSSPIHKKIILNKNGYKIGLLGLMTDTKKHYGLTPIIFEPDLYKVTQLAVDELKNQDKVDIIVLLTHLGLDKDVTLAKTVDNIDIICGGHTHDITKTAQEIIVDKPNGKTIIVHSGDRGLHLGVIKLWPKKDGLLQYEWTLQEIDARITEDKECAEKLQHYKQLLPHSASIAITTVPIDAEKNSLRTKENGFANFVADVIREHFKGDIVLVPGGSLRGRAILPEGPITENDLNGWFPFQDNFLLKLTAQGSHIKQALELAVANLPEESRDLLHPSGLRYTVDVSKQPMLIDKNSAGQTIGAKQEGQRIVTIDVLELNGSYSPLKENKEYSLVITSTMINDLFGAFFMFKTGYTIINTGLTGKEILSAYFKSHATISPNKLGRMIVKQSTRSH